MTVFCQGLEFQDVDVLPVVFCSPRLLNITQSSVDFVGEFQNKVQPSCWNRTAGTCMHMCTHTHTVPLCLFVIVAVVGAEPFSA